METKKGFNWDGRSRITNKKYKENFDRIFKKKEESKDDEPKNRLEQMSKLKSDPVVD